MHNRTAQTTDFSQSKKENSGATSSAKYTNKVFETLSSRLKQENKASLERRVAKTSKREKRERTYNCVDASHVTLYDSEMFP